MRGKRIIEAVLIGMGVAFVYDIGKKVMPSIFV